MIKKGDTFKERFKITEDLRNGFIELFSARAPIHTDANFAKKRKYKSYLIHGNVLSGFISHFVDECLPDKNVMCYAQNIKFNNPVYVNDELLFQAEVKDVHESVNIAEIEFTFENDEKVLVAKGNLMVGINI
jgi:3-hydroxybutyryl-CoA dehydratase